jgi:CRISPR-associated protein Csx17
MASENIPLTGCRPQPLASYLKALGVLRIVAEQADANAAGFWEDEQFCILCRLDPPALTRFFLETYTPTPIIAPWNGGSGFYPKDAKDGITALAQAVAARFAPYRTAIAVGERLLAERGLSERPTDEDKAALIAAVRAEADDNVLAWLDAAVALTMTRAAFPPLLGTGGNDGRLDFTNNFMQRLVGLIDPDSGRPTTSSGLLLDSALFGTPVFGLASVAIGQFAPGAAGGPNASVGYEAASRVNGWDFVLMLEGAVIFAGGVSRRFEGADATYLSYPFTLRAAAAGFGTASLDEQRESRGEVWAPLWRRPAKLAEIRVLFREGRLTVGARPARDGLDAARAVAGLGADRRIAAFERYGFVKRQGLAYLATPLGRRAVQPNPRVELASDLDRGRWLERLRREAASPEAPAALRQAVRSLEEGIFELTASSDESRSLQEVLIAIGRVGRILAISPSLQERLPPPPRLQRDWVRHADDGSPEFRIAAALASLRATAGDPEFEDQQGNGEHGNDVSAPQRRRSILPMRVHIAPVDSLSGAHWAPVEGRSLAVWGNGSLVANLCAVVQKRLLEQSRLGLREKPLAAVGGVGSSDIAFFLQGPAGLDERVAALLLGLVWAEPTALRSTAAAPLPLAYAALKPLFVTDAVLRDPAVALRAELSIPLPPELPQLLAADRVQRAFRVGVERASISGLLAPFVDARPRFADGRRLLAGLSIPVYASVVRDCLSQAYLPAEEPENAA